MDNLVWRTSSYSTGGSGNCVELGPLRDSVVVRDSKHRDGAVLLYPHSEWAAFIGAAKAGTFDLPS